MVKTAWEMTTWINLMSVAVGGAIGSVARYLLTLGSASIPGGSTALGTTLANLLGCAAIGAFAQYTLAAEHVSARAVLAVQVGFLGGLTTFSAFAMDANVMATTGRWGLGGLYVLGNLFFGWAVLVTAATLVRGWMT